jgi:hypothetical protein
MSRRVLKRPPQGWARTREERLDHACASVWPFFVFWCFLCAMAISSFGATVSLINQWLTWG